MNDTRNFEPTTDEMLILLDLLKDASDSLSVMGRLPRRLGLPLDKLHRKLIDALPVPVDED